MKKKLLIAGGVVLGVIAVVVILLFTLFALRRVEVDFRTSSTQDFPSQEQIVDAGQFSYGSPILFAKKSKFAENIEKQYPYVEVVNIETAFPNRLVVHVRERQEVFAFEHNGKTYFCDNNLVILRESDSNFTSTQSNSIAISGLDLGQEELQIGDRLSADNYVDFYAALLACNRTLGEQETIIKSIDFSIYTDPNTNQSAPMMTLHTFAGNDYLIYNTDKYLAFKAQKFWAAFSSLFETYLNAPITTDSESPYSGQNWTEDMLASAYVVINNFYNPSADNPVYANPFPKAQAA